MKQTVVVGFNRLPREEPPTDEMHTHVLERRPVQIVNKKLKWSEQHVASCKNSLGYTAAYTARINAYV